MRLFFLKSTLGALIIVQIMPFLIPVAANALTKWSGIVSVEDTYAETPENSSNLLRTDFNIDINPATKKQLDSRFNVRLNFIESDRERIWNLSPVGNVGVDLNGRSFALNLAHSNFNTITSEAELVRSRISRAALTITPEDLPRMGVNYSSNTVTSENTDTQSDIFSLFTDYRYKWLNLRGGYSSQERSSSSVTSSLSDSLFFGTDVRFTVLPRTTLTGGLDLNRDTSESTGNFESSTLARSLRLSIDSLPTEWLVLNGNFNQDNTDFETGLTGDSATLRRNMDFTSRLFPIRTLELSSTIGKREFDDVGQDRSVTYWTVSTSFRDRIVESIQVGANLSHTDESDPDQGDNLRENFGVNTTIDLTPRIATRFNLNLGKSEIPGFVSSSFFDAAGSLAERDEYDDRPAGFIFFDTEHNDLYTKLTDVEGEWSDPVHRDPVLKQYSVSKTAQLNMILTDKASLNFSYTSNSNGPTIDIAEPGSQTLNSSLWYRPNKRTNYSLTGTANLPQTGSDSYGATLTMSYQFLRGHRMSMTYGNRKLADRTTDTFSTSLRFDLLKRTALEITYSASELFQDEQTDFLRARLSKYF